MKRIFFIVISIVLICVPMAQAESPVDSTACVSGDMTSLYTSDEAGMMSFEIKGIVLSNNESEILNNVSERCVGVFIRLGKEVSQNGYCTYVYPNKDIQLLEWKGVSGSGEWKFVYGTGKWKGVTGGGTWKNINPVQPAAPDTFQICRSIIGSYEMSE